MNEPLAHNAASLQLQRISLAWTYWEQLYVRIGIAQKELWL